MDEGWGVSPSGEFLGRDVGGFYSKRTGKSPMLVQEV